MGDWEFLYDMKNGGYSDEDILEAQSSGATPEEWAEIERQERKEEWEKLKSLRDTGTISREEFKKRKAEIFG
ncbi:SHOCT domain-containing protein [Desulfofustis glycolicus]|uniref:Short C-terminal domain-containing protein n=1 Tax=Desulfofustis glycolicus DSM 9705 TaxID=1121409 RepID=A0A1M5YDA4_9BACT|nr:SHOCT domain-containing protein [Desulfofustis glycolicus]SHI09946.1 Short C-terminal domain-containing protein [Desulfofustis glycolicus DSM 9705]